MFTFNVIVSNTDDHAKNHAVFFNGSNIALTPAYDICPQLRSGGEQQQAMAIERQILNPYSLEGLMDFGVSFDRPSTLTAKCKFCHRPLRDARSIELECGPTCAEEHGLTY